MKNVRIGEALKAGWQSFMKRPWYLFGLALAVGALFVFTVGEAFAAALAYIVYGGYIAVLFRHYRGEQIVFDDLFNIDRRWIYFTFLAVIKGVLIILGLLLFIVPGVYLAIRWMFAEFYVIDEGLRPLEALKASSELTAGCRFKLFLYSVVVSLLLLVGLLFLVVGAFAIGAVVILATIKIYEDLKQVEKPEVVELN